MAIGVNELLGLTGPFWIVLRNLSILLSFNLLYIGLFVRLPRFVGRLAYEEWTNSTVARISAHTSNTTDTTINAMIDSLAVIMNGTTVAVDGFTTIATETVSTIVSDTAKTVTDAFINDNTTMATTPANTTTSTGTGDPIIDTLSTIMSETSRLNRLLRLDDALTVMMGYLVFAVSLMLTYWVVSTFLNTIERNTPVEDHPNDAAGAGPPAVVEHPEAPVFGDNRNDLDRIDREELGAQPDLQHPFDHHPIDNPVGFIDILDQVEIALGYTVSLMKVGFLLWLKMFLLPLVVGVCLDVSTLTLFDVTLEQRARYAGDDIFSATVLHWAVGITFMLFSTVSILQIREVFHPALLAGMIRPQEPQPDLLMNLLSENGLAHMKRMVFSLGIYIILLSIFVAIPARLFLAAGIADWLPFLQFQSWYILTPQLQVPIEVLVFHLTVLGFLEKYKNSIGGLQHHWFKFLCGSFGLTKQTLPASVSRFELVGWKPVFQQADAAYLDDSASDLTTPALTEATLGSSASSDDTIPSGTSRRNYTKQPASSSSSSSPLPASSASAAAATTTTTTTTTTASFPPLFSASPDTITAADTKPSKVAGTTSKMTYKVRSTGRAMREGSQVDPFWYKLSSTKTAKDAQSLIVANMQPPPLPGPIEDFGEALGNGHRTLVGTKHFIRLPLTTAQQDVADRVRRRASVHPSASISSANTNSTGAGSSNNKAGKNENLIATSQGPFRLRRTEHGDGTMVIEFWREVHGDLVARPPEGWDDLGTGSAETQGRWAWGKERKSILERSVACREPFVTSNSSVSAYAVVASKVIAMTVLSWAALIVAVCLAISLPLVAGRVATAILRVPPAYHNDPISFTIGVLLLNPLVGALTFVVSGGIPNPVQFRRWRSDMRLPSRPKAIKFATAVAVWFIVLPCLVGCLYDIAILKPVDYFQSSGSSRSTSSPTMASWVNFATGTLLVNIGGLLACLKAFTRDFWLDIRNIALDEAIPQPPNNDGNHNVGNGAAAGDGVDANAGNAADEPNAESDPEDDNNGIVPWQGQNGRVSRFYGMLLAVVTRWEWDKVDHTVLEECGFSLLRGAAIVLFLPSVVCGVAAVTTPFESMPLPIVGPVSFGLLNMLLFRALVVVTAICRYLLSYKEYLQSWFDAAHTAARDERYLVGETLLDYTSHPEHATTR